MARARVLGGLNLGVAACLAVAIACAPDQLGLPGGGGSDLGQEGTPPAISGGGTTSSALVGDWELLTAIPIGTDFQTSTVLWHFGADASCRQTIRSYSVAEGVSRTTIRDCTYANDVGGIRVTFAGSTPAVFAASFAGFSRDRLVLDGIEYRRVA